MDTINYREILEQSTAVIAVVNPDFEILSISDGFLEVTKNERENIFGQPILNVFPKIGNNIEEIFKYTLHSSLTRVLENKKKDTTRVVRYDIPLTDSTDGGFDVRYWKAINTPILDNNNTVKYIKQIFIDVTHSDELTSQLQREKENLDAYKTAEQYIDKAFRQAPAPVCVLRGPMHVFQIANREFLRIVANKNVFGKPARKAMPELEGQGFFDILDEVYETEKSYSASEVPATFSLSTSKKVDVYIDFVFQILYDTKGNKDGIFVLGTDVTKQVIARKKAEENEFKIRKLIEESPVATAVYVEPNNIVRYANDKMLNYWDKDESIMGMPLYDAVPELKEQLFLKNIDGVYDTGETHTGVEEKTVLIIDGQKQIFYFNYTYKALRDRDGKIYGVQNVVIDVTEQVLARKKVEKSEYKYRSLIEQLPVPTVVFKGPDMIVEYVNDKMLEIWDKDKSTFGKPLIDVQPELKNQPFLDYLNHVYTTGETWSGKEEKAELMSDGKLQTFYFDFTYKALHDKDGGIYGIHCVAIDVTKQVLARRKLQENERTLRQLLDSMPQKISNTDSEGNVVFFNHQWIDETGYTMEELQNNGWIETIHPDDFPLVKENWVNAVQSGSALEVECRIKHKDLGYRWNLTRSVPINDKNGEVIMWVASNTDIHEQKKQKEILENAVKERTKELERANRELLMRNEEIEEQKVELLKANKNLESFAYISSHDLQEPLRKIQIFSDRILENETQNLSEKGKNYFERMEVSAHRMQILIEDLLSFSRVNNTGKIFKIVDLNSIIDDVKEELADIIERKNAIIEASAFCEIRVIRFQFRQLMKNLISNALKFSKPGVPPHIIISGKAARGSELEPKELEDEQKYCHIVVSDNGIGFEPQFSERIFEVFKRLYGKDDYPGTGIGLAIVKKIVDNHNGIITATGEPNAGATFNIYLPTE